MKTTPIVFVLSAFQQIYTRYKKHKNEIEEVNYRTYIVTFSLPRSLTRVPDLGDMRGQAESSSGPMILPSYHEPFCLRTQTLVPTPMRRREHNFRCCEGSDMLPDLGGMGCEAGAAMRRIGSNGGARTVGRWCATPTEE
ncbi:unnamed protein product [Lactuca saligna]|uniref:Uncharacterized protein n=1 Tax=Lactuca saligna TaxID=75948 RepID=A0AA36ENF0_LACSI|nr:unnamed protein product [Lactuca saligna]